MTNYERYQRIANQLNHDAYLRQMNGRNGKPLTHFIPCPKAVVFTAACGENPIPVTMVVLGQASRVPCECHSGFAYDELFNMLFAAPEVQP